MTFMSFAIVQYPTPVLATATFKACFGGTDGSSLLLDEEKLLRPVEMVLLKYSKVQLVKKVEDRIWQICTLEHPSSQALYIDERFLTRVHASFPERTRRMPPTEQILALLQKQIGARYIWGGNWPQGIPQLLRWYQPRIEIDKLAPLLRDTWQLKGFDCSGLLYFATNGSAPRNTSQLITWGQEISIQGKNATQIASAFKPLDLIVWKGHVIIALDSEKMIESRGDAGVVTSFATQRLDEVMQTRKPVDMYTSAEPCFVVRRWY
jgi:cell wall-associated NlpC family hydrolase